MDPQHLNADELSYELKIRRINEEDPNAFERLCRLLQAEERGEVKNPSDEQRLTRQTVNREIQECDLKTAEITKYIEYAVQQADDELTKKGQSRILHLVGRAARLQAFAPGHAAVGRLVARIEELDQHVSLARDSLGSGEQGAAALYEMPEELGEDIGVQPPSTGAIPKTARTSNHQLNPSAPDYVSSNVLPPIVGRSSIASSHKGSHHERMQSLPTRSMDSLSNIFNETQINPPYLAPSVRHFFDDPAVMEAQTRDASRNSQQLRNHLTQHTSQRQRETYLAQTAHNQRPVQYRPTEQFYHQQAPQQQQGRRNQTYDLNYRQPQQPRLYEQRREREQEVEINTNHLDSRSTFSRQDAAGLAGGHRIRQWSLRFSGATSDIDVEDFIFRVERQAQLNGVSHAALAIGLGDLLTERAATWYWTYQRAGECGDWFELKRALLQRYAPRKDTDNEIRAKIEGRKQRLGESFGDFCQDVEAIAVRLVQRMNEEELVEVLRRNMQMALRKALCYTPTRSIGELIRCCNDFEKLCNEEEKLNQIRQRRDPRIHELADYTVEQQGYYDQPRIHHTQPQEIRTYNEPQFRDEAIEAMSSDELKVCWNCKDIGHLFTQCEKPRVGVFCWSCGTSGVAKPQCTRCMGNVRRDEGVTGAPRPSQAPVQILRRLMSQPPPPINPFSKASFQQK